MTGLLVITGAAGFIGSALAAHLNEEGCTDLVLVDDFSRPEKRPNWTHRKYRFTVERDQLFEWLPAYKRDIAAIFHLGARTDTTLQDEALFRELNLAYSQRLWTFAAEAGIPFFYASSAATYGNGEQGFSDDESLLPHLRPLNPYARSKHAFDLWVLQQSAKPPRWAGFKFFNVFGPNEYHKGRMASVVWHGYNQIRREGMLRLFRSHRPDYADGEQKRDFIYVKDVVRVLVYFLRHPLPSGLYNLGTGTARTFVDLAHALFSAMGKPPHIHFIDTPAEIRESYQYFTQAEMGKLRRVGYTAEFTPLEEAVADYVQHYLLPEPQPW
ncbi:MAG: ADP-glyceromanno-heptose 6-epimerase [Bacteroidia bacterium]|jgi:ADP-L-glycero-D-manno-heptose 6-epimerase|nr:ADP-glyceromanno-heptose 6-epimerase [Bacteroidia bacterium]GIV23334.1 MAG: ADP-L-glycero-D-manno-heptose-6-epimerase [Bacteroidia bacterium]